MTDDARPAGHLDSYYRGGRKNGRWESAHFWADSPDAALELARQRKHFAVGHRLGPPPTRNTRP